MYLRIEFEMDNAAFEGDPRPEVTRILEDLIKRYRLGGSLNQRIQDVNGNTVGSADALGTEYAESQPWFD